MLIINGMKTESIVGTLNFAKSGSFSYLIVQSIWNFFSKQIHKTPTPIKPRINI